MFDHAPRHRTRALALVTIAALGAACFGLATGDDAGAVGPNPVTVTITSSANPSVNGQTVTFTVQVTGSAGIPTGKITPYKNGSAHSSVTLDAQGRASWSSTFSPGTTTASGTYQGSSVYAVGSSPTITQTTGPAATTTVVTSNANPSIVGASVTLTATNAAVAPGTCTIDSGTVIFYDGTTQIGTKSASSGKAALSIKTLARGAHAITAVFPATSKCVGSTSPAMTQTVTARPTTTTLTSTPNPSALGQKVTFTATVTSSSGTPTGTVTFTDGATTLGAASLSSGKASVSVTSLGSGTHPVVASYAGANDDAASASTPRVQTVNGAATSTTVASSANPAAAGQPVTFTATVTAGAGIPSGTVTFTDGATTLGTAPLSSGQATLTTSTLGIGTHPIVAGYSGDAAFGASTSPTVTETVTGVSTTAALTSDGNPSFAGHPVTFTATVTAGADTPTGTVTFTDGATTLGTAPLSSGQATLTTSTLGIGTHPVTATYGGTSGFSTSTSPPLGQSVLTPATTTSLGSSANPSTTGQPVTLTATITAAAGSPTGTVTFSDGATSLGSAPIASGQASVTTSALSVGGHSITARYTGDATYTGSTSPTLTQTVNGAATTTALGSDANPSAAGQAVTFTATVTSGAGTPTGTVTFTDGATSLGIATLTTGTATLTTGALAPGSHAVTATYNGDTVFSGSTSPTVTQSVTGQPSNTALASSVNPSTAGQAVTFTATVTSGAGTPTGTVTFTDGATSLGTATLTTGTATLTTSALTAGTHALTATYNGSATFMAGTSPTVTQTVNAVSSATNLFVDKANPACANSGTGVGTAAKPFCAINSAAAKATAGVTVVVATGTYNEKVTVVSSGTASAPVTFTNAPGATVTLSGGSNGFSISSRSWVVIHGFTVTGTTGVGITVSSSSNITIDGNHVSNAGVPVSGSTATGIKLSSTTTSTVSGNTTDHNSDAGVLVTTDANNNTIRDNTSFANARGYVRAAAGFDLRNSTGNLVYGNVSHDNEDSGINVWTGTTWGSNLVDDNVTYANGDHGIDVHNAVDARIISNTVYANYDSGIEMTTSVNSLLANNISVDNGMNSVRTSGDIRADGASVTGGSTVNDDLVNLSEPGVMIDWGGVKYPSLAAFRTATGQESRGVEADPRFVDAAGADFHLLAGSPAIDAANTSIASEPAVDFDGTARVDDPATVDTGIGPITYADRGAFEYRP